MNVSTMDTVRTMAITHMSYETKRYTEADYDTAVEYSVMNIMDEEYLFSLHLGEFEVLVEIGLVAQFQSRTAVSQAPISLS